MAFSVDISHLIHAATGTRAAHDVSSTFEGPLDNAEVLSPLQAQMTLVRLENSIVATLDSGHIRLRRTCIRCLTEFELDSRMDKVDREYELRGSESDAHIDTHKQTLDLTDFLNEEVILSLTDYPLCREDCQGLCLECGANRNKVDCGHSAETTVIEEEEHKPLSGLKELYEKHSSKSD